MRLRRTRITAAALAVAAMAAPTAAGASPLPAPALSEVPTAAVPATGHTVPTREAVVGVKENPNADPEWRGLIAGRDNVHEVWAHSPSMRRNVPMVWIHPAGAEPTAPRPTLYVLNGADGGEGKASWLYQSDILDFFSDKDVNVIVIQAGKYSYYTDWVNQGTELGAQYWETFLTRELPGPLERRIGAAGRDRGLIGMSMSGTSSLLFAEHHPGLYAAVGSFSGCASTSDDVSASFIDLVLDRANATGEDMWGPRPSELWTANDALLGVESLGDTPAYISNGSGLWGAAEFPGQPDINAEIALTAQRTAGSVIEAATNLCTRNLKARMDAAGVGGNVIWDFGNVGTHSWSYWQEDLHQSWEQLFSRVLR